MNSVDIKDASSVNFEERSFWEEEEFSQPSDNAGKDSAERSSRKKLSSSRKQHGKPEADRGDSRDAQKGRISQVKVKNPVYSDGSSSTNQVQAVRMREIHRKMAQSARERLRRRKQERALDKKRSSLPSPTEDEARLVIDRDRFVADVEGITKQLQEINLRLEKRYLDVLCQGAEKQKC